MQTNSNLMSNDEQNKNPEPQTEGAATEIEAQQPKQRRGFAAMDRARVREIAARGGVAAHVKGTAHRFTSDEARAAGKKGGQAPHRVRGGPRRAEA